MPKTAKTRKLLIVESPAKARTLGKFLGGDFTVKASLGHVRDLQKGSATGGLGIDIQHGFTPYYQVIPGKEKTLQVLREAAAKAQEIYLAPDPDREGEAIAWHIQQVLDLPPEKTFRITYNAITKKAVSEALSHPRAINMNLVNAQQGRRILDRLVGFKLSPFLWTKVAKNLSAGRVQSVAVRLLVEREAEIRAFVAEPYWSITAQLQVDGGAEFFARLKEWQGKAFALGNPQAASELPVKQIVAQLQQARYQLQEISAKEQQRTPPPPFITSTLQQGASTAFGFSPSRTMVIAQRLYEGVELGELGAVGLITYMRTDSVRVEPEAIEEARHFIAQNYPPPFLPKTAQIYRSKGGAQDAHEAIRPAAVANTPEMVKPHLTPELYKLYTLIWRRFVASQMSPARYQSTTICIAAAEGLLEAKGRVLLFPGYTKLWGEEGEELEPPLPLLQGNESLSLLHLNPEEHTTKPPARYSEAGLIRSLEKEGVGRPSTYAPIIQTIQERGYAYTEKRSFHATELGMAVTQLLLQHFPDIVDPKFTAGMEDQLDKVEEGQCDWVEMLGRFYGPFAQQLGRAEKEAQALKGRIYQGDAHCPLCSGSMLVRYSQKGAFLSCARFPECRGSLPFPGEGGEQPQVEKSCSACGRAMIIKTSRFGKKFYACSGYPECRATLPMDKDGQVIELPKVEADCQDCGRPMTVKMGPRGPFLSCSGYPACKSTLPLDKEGKVVHLPRVSVNCEKCGQPMLAKMGRRGPFLACSGYPKCRNAKPLPEEGELSFAEDAAPSRKFIPEDSLAGAGTSAVVGTTKAKASSRKKASASKVTAKASGAKKRSAAGKVAAKGSSKKRTSASQTTAETKRPEQGATTGKAKISSARKKSASTAATGASKAPRTRKKAVPASSSVEAAE